MAEWPKGHRTQWRELVELTNGDERFSKLDPELQTDKELVKVIPCPVCRRPLIVTTFYVMAWAMCSVCKGDSDQIREPGSVEVVQIGRTDPKLAADLTKLLINPSFASAICPVHPAEGHEMELKSVHWNDNYGPWEYRLIDGKLVPAQIAPGETVVHQCLQCRAVVTYTTTEVTQLRRRNEPDGQSIKKSGWRLILGAREEPDGPIERRALYEGGDLGGGESGQEG